MAQTLYAVLGVDPAVSPEELRTAYRAQARLSHPDVVGEIDGGRSMAKVNDAWRVLSDPYQRRLYDETLKSSRVTVGDRRPARPPAPTPPDFMPQPPPASASSRRNAWVAGVRAQIGRLASLAGRSATQTLLLHKPRATREIYDRLAETLVVELMRDTEPRVRAARAAGSAPLDLGVSATLVGIRSLADQVRRDASHSVTPELLMTAELLDRMWDILAHELPIQLSIALGGNPQVANALTH
jgi:curved DNA-binding protein CbpA